MPRTIVPALLLVLLAPPPARCESKCAAKKIVLAGRKALGELKCRAQEIKHGVTPAADCTVGPSAKFHAGWIKAEDGDDCLTSGDESTIEGKVDAFFGDVESDLVVAGPGPSRCTARKLQTTGKKVLSRGKCDAKAIARGLPVKPECLAKANEKFSSSWAKAELADDCQTLGDAATLESKADALEDDVVTDVVP